MLECQDGARDDFADLAVKLCDRHYGIGADGILVVQPSKVADFRMRIINTDGSEAEMCGNGIRCFSRSLYDFGLTKKTKFTVETGAGVLVPELTVEAGKVTTIRVDMGEPHLLGQEIPVLGYDDKKVINESIEVAGMIYQMTGVSMGNPHCVIFVDDAEKFPIAKLGTKFEHHALFPRKTNTEFVQVLSRHEINMRVWERGSGETLACGTGTCASAVACVLNGKTDEHLTVHLLGGDLEIFYDRANDTVWMTGPASVVFDGELSEESIKKIG